eukprot:SAG11_NODE_61_length_19011_cov_49.624048_2_plen_113_part_00
MCPTFLRLVDLQGLSKDQVARLESEFHIYMVASGRISMAGVIASPCRCQYQVRLTSLRRLESVSWIMTVTCSPVCQASRPKTWSTWDSRSLRFSAHDFDRDAAMQLTLCCLY